MAVATACAAQPAQAREVDLRAQARDADLRAQARGADTRFLHFGAETEPPRGYTAMCQTQPDLCRLPTEEKPEAPGGDGCADFACLMTPLPSPTMFRIEVTSQAKMQPPPPAIRPAALVQVIPLFRAMPSVRMMPSAPMLTDDHLWLERIARINAHVNRHVKQVEDLQSYGSDDVWRPAGTGPGATGDCEDLALEKRQELIAAGFPASRLFIAIAFRQETGLHAVLVARLADGDRVLDSGNAFVRPVAQTGYAWLSLQRPETPDRWFYPA
ncbi:transglutaminase-like cysteine peptidase [Novosphingobium rosa]|uniref:transglutaminase-like cysteine peptidase n=1 Tax=Novosphingobium rosa TaxID=76978 RepID=UPI001471B349|nr:transglutaminase-like cysteine peptidase [Novosphingobium rosa]